LKNKKVAIIGGGILGLAIGYQLTRKYPGIKIHLFEKENEIGLHQSGNNSGVLHCGLHYLPGSLKARMAVEGIREMIRFCKINEIEHDICGKIVVASDEREVGLLEDLAGRGQKNGLYGLKFLNREEIRLREPHVHAKKALLVPEEGIVNYRQVMHVMAGYILEANGTISTGQEIKKVESALTGEIIIQTAANSFSFDSLVNCTGLFSDRTFQNLTGKKRPLRIIPFRGEYMNIKNDYKHLVNHLIYPVPDPKYPFLGLHFTRLTNGAREVGPNAVLALKREGYTNKDFNMNDFADAVIYKGLHKFVFKNFNFTLGELKSSLSTKAFVKKAKKLVPDVESYMFDKGTAGVRAQAMDPDGKLIMDFQIEKIDNQIHLLNAPSPGATASLSIANYIIDNYMN
jgi:L-2-hydroxyglutarate oxidase